MLEVDFTWVLYGVFALPNLGLWGEPSLKVVAHATVAGSIRPAGTSSAITSQILKANLQCSIKNKSVYLLGQWELSEISVARDGTGRFSLSVLTPRSADFHCQNGITAWPLEGDDTLLDSSSSKYWSVLVLHKIQPLQLWFFVALCCTDSPKIILPTHLKSRKWNLTVNCTCR